MTGPWCVFVESNTTGTGRDFAVAAARRGLRPILLSRDSSRYRYVDELRLPVRQVDTSCVNAVEKACDELLPDGIAGIMSSSEYFVHTAAWVAVRLGLPAPNPTAVERCRNKATQRRWLAPRGIPMPDFRVCTTPEQAATALAGRVVVKPAQGTGSYGVRACTGAQEVAAWAERLLADPATGGQVLVEREIQGPEYSVEILDGRIAGITRKHLGEPPHFVETGHDFPAQLSAARAARLQSVAIAAVGGIGLTSGPAHVELRISGDGQPQLIEINPRLAGGLIPRLARYATGRDLIDEVVAGATGGRPLPVDARNGFASIRFVVATSPGVVGTVRGIEEARATPGIVETQCVVSGGTQVHIRHSFADRIGHVIATGPDAADTALVCDRAVAGISVEYAASVAAP